MDDLDTHVAYWVHPSSEWDRERLKTLLPNDVLSLIAGMKTPKPELGEDKMIWGLERDGRFRLKSPYYLTANNDEEDVVQSWKLLWKWKGPNRIKHFLWLVLHDKLFTNRERTRRKIATNPYLTTARTRKKKLSTSCAFVEKQAQSGTSSRISCTFMTRTPPSRTGSLEICAMRKKGWILGLFARTSGNKETRKLWKATSSPSKDWYVELKFGLISSSKLSKGT
ncbi:unnamed protein product [Linum trigynum]|uniref:Reverse transcriptase zinc-binding domain-containing protein n=1 Tax=Linum trigynum TaxID=586398 RepID=A0AAV2DR32_9ROSI